MSKEEVSDPGASYQMFQVTGQTGEVDITATIAREGGLLGASSHSATTQIQLVEDVVIKTADLSLFEPEAGNGVSKHGSGHFTIKQVNDLEVCLHCL